MTFEPEKVKREKMTAEEVRDMVMMRVTALQDICLEPDPPRGDSTEALCQRIAHVSGIFHRDLDGVEFPDEISYFALWGRAFCACVYLTSSRIIELGKFDLYSDLWWLVSDAQAANKYYLGDTER